MNKYLVAGFSLLLLGLVLGWFARGIWIQTPVEPNDSVPRKTEAVANAEARVDWLDEFEARPSAFLASLSAEPLWYQIERMRAFGQRYGDQFVVLMGLSNALAEQGEFEEALDILLRSSAVTGSISEQDLFELNLARLIDEYSRVLISLNQFDPLDKLYEEITLSLPQLAQYHLQLGLLRIRMGNLTAALAPLAQIANNDQLGVEARRLMAQIESPGSSPREGQTEELPLITAGSQFLVEAKIDESVAVTVLIDTGAAMTVLESKLLADLGYNLGGRQEYFITANGVVQAPVVTLESLSLGSAKLGQVAVGALELGLPGSIQGLLGMNFLRHYDFRIDQNRGVLILEPR